MFLGLHYHPLCQVQWVLQRVAKEVLSLQRPWQRTVVLIYFCFFLANLNTEEIREEEGEKVKHEIKIPQNFMFGDTLKNQHIHSLVHGHSSWSMFSSHLKALKWCSFINLTIEV